MIKIFYILLIILFNQSCDSFDEIISELDESEIDLEFEYYIQEGWLSFQSDNYASAATFFNYIIEASKDSSSQSLSTISSELLFEAYHGISWSQVFSANISEDTNQKSALRENSYLNFFTSDSILKQISLESTDYPFDYDCDIIAGKILYHDYKIYSSYSQYFSFDGDNQFLNDIEVFSNGEDFEDLNFNDIYDEVEQFTDYNQNGYFEPGLNFLVNKLIDECPNYNFPFQYLNINNFKMMLLKDYLRRGMYDEIIVFIGNMNLPTIDLEFQLNSEVSLNDDLFLIGDFQNKVIDTADLYALDSEGKVTINVTPFLPCNLNNLSTISQSNEENLRDELLDCIDTYFERSNQVDFRYKFINGPYDGNISNQENDLPSNCSDIEGYRSVTISIEDNTIPLSMKHCFNSCSDSCYNY